MCQLTPRFDGQLIEKRNSLAAVYLVCCVKLKSWCILYVVMFFLHKPIKSLKLCKILLMCLHAPTGLR